MSELRLNTVTDKDTDKSVNVDALYYQNTQLVRNLGPWQPGLVFENKTDYAIYNDQAIVASGGATLPYTTQGADPTASPDSGNVVPFSESITSYFSKNTNDLASGITLGDRVIEKKEGQVWQTLHHTSDDDQGGGLYIIEVGVANGFDRIDIGNGLVAVLQPVNGEINISQVGFFGESLVDDTQEYKGVSYNVKRYTQNKDSQEFFQHFFNDERYKTLNMLDKKVYKSFVSNHDFSGKRITGSGGKECGFIVGSFDINDGTQSCEIDNVGFFGAIDYIPLPLPATNFPEEAGDLDKFYTGDCISFGYGFGALSTKTATSDGSLDDVNVHHCYFEMRAGVISGGSAPDDEDRPKTTNVRFWGNTTKNIMAHGFAGIHYRYAKGYDNHFEEHYNGYACDLSLGSQDSEFYSNTGKKLAGCFKAETREVATNSRNKFYDNHLVMDGGFGAAFTIATVNTGSDTEIYDNTIVIKDINKSPYANRYSGTNTICKDNRFYIVGDGSGLTWLFLVRNHFGTSTLGQQTDINGNQFYNRTSSKIRSGLWVGSQNAVETHGRISHNNNRYTGDWERMIDIDYTGSADVTIDRIEFKDNYFPNTVLFKAGQAITIGTIISESNEFLTKDAASAISLSFINLTESLICDTDNGVSGNVDTPHIHYISGTGGMDLSSADIRVTNANIIDLTAGFLYLYQDRAEPDVKSVTIRGNSVKWHGSSNYGTQVRARGAQLFLCHGNTLVNDYETSAVNIQRPVDGNLSQYNYNIEVGTVDDAPAT